VSLLQYWPSSSEINACIKPEAEGASSAVLLAVHQPAPLVYRLPKSTQDVRATEAELFDFFMTEDVPTGAHIVPITGASGVGKSHLIRLIAARVQALPDSERYVLVSIPKSASLRKVVDLIVNLLPPERYAGVRSAFNQALMEVDEDTAAIRFRSALEISLLAHARDLATRVRQSPTDQELKQQLQHAQSLPRLLSDAITQQHYLGVLRRVVKGALSGHRSLQSDSTQIFAAGDLDLPESIDLTQAAVPVQVYYRTALQALGGRGKTIAADVLNDVLDPAIGQLFHLNESLGGMTFQDVILEIRKLLLHEHQELVLLVEDFRALTGIQETLLNVLIQEGVRDGVRVYATMRSAIAVTEGYLTGRDTIATRATREWIIQSQLSTEDVTQRTRFLIAAYLNAARWGLHALETTHAPTAPAERSGQITAPVFNPEEDDQVAKQLNAFGSASGVPLFPFTEMAIDYMVDFALKEGAAPVFKPRAIISFLRDVLLLGRAPFESGSFPPASVKARRPATDVAQWLATQSMSASTRERYERLVVIWGNDPQRRVDILRIPSEVFKSFRLPSPVGIEAAAGAPPPSVGPLPPPIPPSAPDEHKIAKIDEYRQELERWVQPDAPQLKQSVASSIRSAVSAGLVDRIDWNRERCVRIPIGPSQISIPNAHGSGREAANAIPITSDRSDPDGRLRGELIALLRFRDVWDGSMDYPEAEDDLAVIGNLLDRLLPPALSWVRSNSQRQMISASSLLAANSRMLGITDQGRSASALSTFLFGSALKLDIVPDDAPEEFKAWIDVRTKAEAIRPHLRSALLETCGCFQGSGSSGKTPNGVDITRITESFSEDTETNSADLQLPQDVRRSLPELSDIRITARAKHVAKAALVIRTKIKTHLGDPIDKHELANAILELAQTLSEQGAWPQIELNYTFAELKTLCEDFRRCALMETLGQLEKVEIPDGTAGARSFIAQVAKVNLAPLLVASVWIDLSDRLIDYGNRYAQQTVANFEDIRPEIQAKRVRDDLDGVLGAIADLQNEGV